MATENKVFGFAVERIFNGKAERFNGWNKSDNSPKWVGAGRYVTTETEEAGRNLFAQIRGYHAFGDGRGLKASLNLVTLTGAVLDSASVGTDAPAQKKTA